VDINSAVGRKAGLTDEKLLAVTQDDLTVFTDVERLVIELADAMAATPANVSDDLYTRLRMQFSEEQLLDLGAHIAFENYRARLNRVFDVESDGLYAPGSFVAISPAHGKPEKSPADGESSGAIAS
jgi:alkylhydroperoxidase family enzyme